MSCKNWVCWRMNCKHCGGSSRPNSPSPITDVKHSCQKHREFSWLLLVLTLTAALLQPAHGQWPLGVPATPQSQRNALGAVRAQVGWVQNATQVAPNYGAQGYGNV